MYPSPGQMEVLWALAGKDPYEWDTTYQQYIIVVGQGGGKNQYIVAPYVGYLSYKIANMKDPWRYFSRFYEYSVDRGKKFEIANHSLVNEDQAENVHFSNMVSIIRRCRRKGKNWFETYTGMDTRSSIGDIKEKKIKIETQPGCGAIILHSFDSTVDAAEGLTLIADIVDEPSRADTQAGYKKAKKLYNFGVGNLNTRYGKNVGKLITFSYINTSEYDLTWELHLKALEEVKKSHKPVMYTINKSTFEMNPNVKRTDPDIEAAYRNDPTDAAARYEGVKGATQEGFYQPYVFKVKESFFELDTPVTYSYDITVRTATNPLTGREETREFRKVVLDQIKGDNRVRAWAYDPAEKYDSFVLKGGYIETMDEMRDELFIDNRQELVVINKRPIVDIVIVWQPTGDIPVDYVNVGEVLGVLLDKFPNSRSAKSDKWNSAKLMQEILSRGVHTETLSFSRKQQMIGYTKLRWMMFSNIPMINKDMRTRIIKRGIEKTVGEWNVEEHERLMRVNDKIEHPADGSKDLCDVDMILINDLAQLEVADTSGLGVDRLNDTRILALAEKYIRERQKLLNASVPEKDHVELIAAELGIPLKDVKKLKEYVDDNYAGYLNL